jgi:PAS domain S-box-containing protein
VAEAGAFVMSTWVQADEELLQHFFGASLDMLCIAGFDGYFKRLNKAWSKTLGYTEDELMAAPYLDFVHPGDRDATIAEAQKIAYGHDTVWFQNRYRCRDGTYRWFLWRAAPDAERGVIYAVARDVTEQKQLEDRLRLASSWQRAILDSANFTIISCRPDGIIETMNANALNELGYAAEELIGRVTPEILHDRGEVEARARELSVELETRVLPGFDAFIAKAKLGRPDEYEWTYVRKDGSRFPILLSVTAMRDTAGEIVGFLGIGTNLTERKRSEAARRNAEQRMQAVMDNASAVIFMKGVDGCYVMINRKFEELFHISREAVVGKRDDEIFPAELAHAFQENDRRVIDAGGPVQFEEIAPHDDGPHTYVSVKFPIYDDSGRVAVVCGIATDITDRKRSEEELRERESRMRAILDNAVEGIITMGGDRLIQTFNAASVKMFGYEPGEVIGNDVTLLLPDLSRAGHNEGMGACLRTGEAGIIGSRVEVEGRRKDGSSFPVELTVSETQVRGGALFTAMVHDITMRKEAEVELLRSNEDLEQFASIASHDLKEPLRMVSNYLQLLERRYSAKLDAEARQFIGFAVGGAQRMRQLVEDLLEYSRVSTRGKPLVPVNSSEVLRAVRENLKLAIAERGACLTQDEGMPVVLADGTQLAQVFQNLIENALKFRGAETPRIHVGATHENGRWIFAVSDNGIGIEEKFFERIFEIFQRLHTTQEYEGTGIGLAVCKKIVERHGGRIWVESTRGKGTTFRFTLLDARSAQPEK